MFLKLSNLLKRLFRPKVPVSKMEPTVKSRSSHIQQKMDKSTWPKPSTPSSTQRMGRLKRGHSSTVQSSRREYEDDSVRNAAIHSSFYGSSGTSSSSRSSCSTSLSDSPSSSSSSSSSSCSGSSGGGGGE